MRSSAHLSSSSSIFSPSGAMFRAVVVLEKESVLLCVLLLWNVFSYEMKWKEALCGSFILIVGLFYIDSRAVYEIGRAFIVYSRAL